MVLCLSNACLLKFKLFHFGQHDGHIRKFLYETEEFNEANTDSQVAQSVREILQHAHRHVSDAIDCDENNYGESAVRSYSLAMDYFKTYLKMNAIGISGGKFGAFRAVARWNSSDGKKTCTKKRSEDVVFLFVYIVVFVCFSLRFFFFVCLFHSLATTYKNGRLRDVCLRERMPTGGPFSGFATKSSFFASFSHQCSFNVFVSLFPSLSLTFRSNND